MLTTPILASTAIALVMAMGNQSIPNNPAQLIQNQPSGRVLSGQISNPVNIWWPTSGVKLSGTQPFKAVLDNVNLQSYTMFWSVDGGQQNQMWNDFRDYPHKQADVNVTNWNWKGNGPYNVEFRAYDNQGKFLTSKSVSFTNFNQPVTPAVPAVQPPVINLPVQPATNPPAPSVPPIISQPVNSQTNNPPAPNTNQNSSGLYVDVNSDSQQWLNRQTDKSSPYYQAINKIAQQPQGLWFGGWNSNVENDVRNVVNSASSKNQTPVLVAYNIPQRDCGGYSAGGVGSPDAYRKWINSFANGIGNNRAIVILEPDSLSGIDCLSQSDQQVRMQLIREATERLKANSQTKVYLDSGHAKWQSVELMTKRLQGSGIDRADGFALNVSNFVKTSDNIQYGKRIAQIVGKHFIIDTGRNGSGPTDDSQWCNPAGRSLGELPTLTTGDGLIDAYLWIKPPGSSDGACSGGPNAGQFWPDYAVGLVSRSGL